MEARSVVEAALQAMINQDIQQHMRWIDDDVAVESSVALPLTAKLRYLQQCAPALVPGTGMRLKRYGITQVGALEPDGQWIRVMLTFEVPKDGKPYPTGPSEYVTQQSEASYRVREDRIVRIMTRSLPQALHLSFE